MTVDQNTVQHVNGHVHLSITCSCCLEMISVTSESLLTHKLIRMTQLTPMIVVELMTLIVTMIVSVTWFGPSQGVGCGVCAMFEMTMEDGVVSSNLSVPKVSGLDRAAISTRAEMMMEDGVVSSNLSVPKVSDSDRAATSTRAKKSPKPREHVQLLCMEQDRKKGVYSEKC